MLLTLKRPSEKPRLFAGKPSPEGVIAFCATNSNLPFALTAVVLDGHFLVHALAS
jgi:hypothetical protein